MRNIFPLPTPVPEKVLMMILLKCVFLHLNVKRNPTVWSLVVLVLQVLFITFKKKLVKQSLFIYFI